MLSVKMCPALVFQLLTRQFSPLVPKIANQSAITCSKLLITTLEQGAKYVKS